MEQSVVSFMRQLAPDLAEELALRASVLERISVLQPVGRRQLAAAMNLPENDIRSIAEHLSELDLISRTSLGMSLTQKGESLLPEAVSYSRSAAGLGGLEVRLQDLGCADRVVITPGDASQNRQVAKHVVMRAAGVIPEILRHGDTVAVTGDAMVAEIAAYLTPATASGVMIVPAEGGLGQQAALQADTAAAAWAEGLEAHYRLLHVPDTVTKEQLQSLMQDPDIAETMERIRRAGVVIHGVSHVEEAAQVRRMSSRAERDLIRDGAAGVMLGTFLRRNGQKLLQTSNIAGEAGAAHHDVRLVAVAAGSEYADALAAALKNRRHGLLVTDEGTAARLLTIW